MLDEGIRLVDRASEPVIHYASPVGANIYAKVAQMVEHSTENAGVGGSIPPLGTGSPKENLSLFLCTGMPSS
jgi:hypothetical protein